VNRTLLIAGGASGTPVIVELVAVPRAELDDGILRTGAQAAVAFTAVPA
jgi:hypothetical protein